MSTGGNIVTIKGKFNGLDVEFLPDTGAEVTVVPRKFVCEAQLSDQFVTIEGATGTPERTPLATVNLEVLGESFSKQVAVSSSMDKSCRVLYSIPLGGKLPEILFKSAREQERHAKCEASKATPREESKAVVVVAPNDTELTPPVDAQISQEVPVFTEVSPSRVSVSPEVCSRAAEAAESVSVGSSIGVTVSPEVCSRAVGVAESVSVSSSVSSSVRPEVCSRAANGSGSVVVEPVEVSVSPESVASTAANVVGEKIEKTEASVAVEVVELRKRNLQVEEEHGSR